jgi:peptidoglycan hydrolase CwlO-like protein
MTKVDEKKILEIEKLKQDIQLDMKRFDVEQEKLRLAINQNDLDIKRFDTDMKRFDTDMKRFDIELSKKHYEAWRVALYGIAVGLGGTFAIAKTISLMGW